MRTRALAKLSSGPGATHDPYTHRLLPSQHVRTLAACLVVGAAVTFGLRAGGETAAKAQVSARGTPDPNVIVVTVDDQGLGTFSEETMPRTFKMLDDGAGQELEGYASPPLCCPSRAGFATGQYPQNHGVVHNSWTLLREPDNTLPAWLQADGYRTGFVGKYLNNHTAYPAPAGGFDSWFELRGPRGYYGYEASDDGVIKRYGNKRSDYSTTVVTEESEKFIRQQAAQDAPFFLWTAYFAPHARKSDGDFCGRSSPLPLVEDFRKFSDLDVELSRSYDEKNNDDKPSRVRNRPRLPAHYADLARDRFRCTVAALQEVDRGIADIRALLRREELDDDTIIVYTSDNGYFFGEHRLREGKKLPYQEAVRVPMIAHVPPRYLGGSDVSRVDQSVANIDLAPTILDFANADPCTQGGQCRVMDGRSIVPLLEGGDGGWPDPRPISIGLPGDCSGYNGLYQGREVYFEWLKKERGECSFAERELYDLRQDPFQLRNRLYKPSGGAIRDGERLSELAARLMNCAGIEGRDPRQQGRPFC